MSWVIKCQLEWRAGLEANQQVAGCSESADSMFITFIHIIVSEQGSSSTNGKGL